VPTKRPLPLYVTCEIRSTNTRANGEVYEVRPYPQKVWGNRRFRVAIPATAIAAARVPNLKRVGQNERTWAAAYYVLDLLRSQPSIKSRSLSISATANELGDTVWRASRQSVATLATWCPKCAPLKLIKLREGRIYAGKKPKLRGDFFVVRCPSSKSHAFRVSRKTLLYHVEARQSLPKRS
jgi:hypothetical protein